MLQILGVLLTSAVTFFGAIDGWFGEEIYNFATWAFSHLVQYLTLAAIKFQILAVTFAWDVASQMLSDLNISSFIAEAWGAIPGDLSSALGFFGVPEAVNILISALGTKFVLRFVPFGK